MLELRAEHIQENIRSESQRPLPILPVFFLNQLDCLAKDGPVLAVGIQAKPEVLAGISQLNVSSKHAPGNFSANYAARSHEADFFKKTDEVASFLLRDFLKAGIICDQKLLDSSKVSIFKKSAPKLNKVRCSVGSVLLAVFPAAGKKADQGDSTGHDDRNILYKGQQTLIHVTAESGRSLPGVLGPPGQGFRV